MTKFTTFAFSAIVFAGLGLALAPAAGAQTDGRGDLSESPDTGGSRPDRDRDHFASAGSGNSTARGGWSCPPVSTNQSGSGRCGLPVFIQEEICNGHGGGSSTRPDGGYECSIPD